MANLDWPSGLRPIGNGRGGTAPQITKYTRSSTGALYEGALLIKDTTGPVAYNGTTADHAYQVIGVAAHYHGASETDVYVYDDPDQEFLVQGDSAVTTPLLKVTWMGPVTAVTGNATTLQSKTELDTSSLTATYAAFDCLQIVRLWDAQDNDQDAANAKWVVKITRTAHIHANNSTRAT